MSASRSGRRRTGSVALGDLLQREASAERAALGCGERPSVAAGQACRAKKGEDFALLKPACERRPGAPSTSFSAFALFDGHNGSAAAVYAKEHLLGNVLSCVPTDLAWDDWLAALPRALVAGFVKTDKDFQTKAHSSGTTVTLAIIDGSVVTVASVGDSRCVLEAEGSIYYLSADHRFDANEEEVGRVTECGGEVGRLNVVGGAELSNAGGRLIISSDGVWDALTAEMAFKCARGLPPEAAAEQIVKEAVEAKGLRDDTTCIVIDIISPEKPKRTIQSQRTPGKGLVLLKNFFLRKTTSDSLSLPDKDNYPEPDLEEVFEDGCPSLSRRLNSEYPVRDMFKLFACAICQIDLESGQGISIHEGLSRPGKLRPWDGPFLCHSCQEKKEAMEGKRHSRALSHGLPLN
ncbi:putative protein phosphatase 2C 12 [Zea mays]|uniref:protein-serine/threonine phosphatase n=1 Tax=Zea mays TaxID=4577 RepID=A0A1D6J7Q0_MAIZE|nr:putative protein phosphatase 2C 12 [Zea mays]